MILTELRGYGIAENRISVNSKTNQIHHWKELEETIQTIPNTQYCQKMSYVPLEIIFFILYSY